MPTTSTVYRWIEAHESFRQSYARARLSQADEFAAETLRLASQELKGERHKKKILCDGTTEEEVVTADSVDRARLMVDTRKWLIGKLFPRRYGDKVEEEAPTSGIAEMFKALSDSDRGTPDMDESE